VDALAAETVRRFGAVHIVCNNAGVATFGEIATSTHADWEFTMRVNFWGVVHGIEAFVPRLLAQGQGGHVVNTASMAGLVGMQWLGIYCASKFAVVGLTEALHRELKPHGIGASVLCPMIVATNGVRSDRQACVERAIADAAFDRQGRSREQECRGEKRSHVCFSATRPPEFPFLPFSNSEGAQPALQTEHVVRDRQRLPWLRHVRRGELDRVRRRVVAPHHAAQHVGGGHENAVELHHERRGHRHGEMV